MTTGRCLCGTVRYEIDGPFSNMAHCHCSMCRKHHGAAFATFVGAPIGGFRWLKGESEIDSYQSSRQGTRSFCRHCGSVAPMLLPDMGMVLCPAGNLEGDLGIKPQAHWFVGSKAPWYAITDLLPQHAEYPPEFDIKGVERGHAEGKAGVVTGSCLCGDVRFELEGAPFRMWHCHCSRCRRARSAAHASNVFYKFAQLRFLSGADRITDFKVPEARLFGVAFCRRCGSEVPRAVRERDVAVVPGGSLDQDPGIRALAHIFVASKAKWDDITDTTPQYAEVPPA
jgi:hypothetical protein